MPRPDIMPVKKNTSNRPKPFAKRSFGQNFLINEPYIRKIVDAARIGNEDTIIEIGPGRGALTRHLGTMAKRVIAIELDADLIPELETRLKEFENFEIINEDVLKIDFSDLVIESRAKVVANLPYYISTAVLQHLIEQRESISEMVLMFQREVVDRIVAKPGNSERGYLTVIAEAFLDIEKLFDVPPSAFKPAPKVWSSVVRATPKRSVSIEPGREIAFDKLVSAAFRQKRKTLLNNLKTAPTDLRIRDASAVIADAGIDPSRRAESLWLEEWQRLFNCYTSSSDV